MGRGWRPVLAGAAVVVAVFLLAQWPIFKPSTSDGPSLILGDAERGEVIFERECSSCHGVGGTGAAGPRLVESGLEPEEIALTIEQGSGVMLPAIVTGQDQADVVAYVASISGSS